MILQLVSRTSIRFTDTQCQKLLPFQLMNIYQRLHSIVSHNISQERPAEELISLARSLPCQFLRDMDPSKYDTITGQRNDIKINWNNGKPRFISTSKQKENLTIQNCWIEDNKIHVKWSDNHQAAYSIKSIEKAAKNWRQPEFSIDDGYVYWTGLDEQSVRSSSLLSINFKDLIGSNDGQTSALRSLYQYGIALVTGTPVNDNGAGVAALASSLGGGSVKDKNSILHQYRSGGKDIMLPHGTDGPLRTLYGTVWSTSASAQPNGASVADSAYGHEGLPLHTDLTYHRDPPGLQIFTMKHKASKGGESVFCDGFAAANYLRLTNHSAFSTLSNTIRTYRSVDRNTGWILEANGTVISVFNGRICMIRHNDLDRLPDLPSDKEPNIDFFYNELSSAHEAWNRILADDERRLVITLQEGDTMVVSNQVSSILSGT